MNKTRVRRSLRRVMSHLSRVRQNLGVIRRQNEGSSEKRSGGASTF